MHHNKVEQRRSAPHHPRYDGVHPARISGLGLFVRVVDIDPVEDDGC